MDQTARFALPFLAPGQAQKEWFVNESLQRIDMLLCAAVEGPPTSDPPADPQPGQCYLVGEAAIGAWAGHEGAIAGFCDGGWRFVEPVEGARVLIRSSGETMLRRNGSWESGIVRGAEFQLGGQRVLAERQPAIAGPAGGTVADVESRAAISAILAVLQAHGLIET